MIEKAITLGFAFIMASSTPATSATDTNLAIKSKYTAYAMYEDNTSEVPYIVSNNKLNENIRKLEGFLAYEKNWNGYNAEPFQDKLINTAKNVLRNLPYQPDVFPTANNSIQIEYEKDNGEYLEFEIFNDGNIHLFGINENNAEYEKDSVTLMEIINYVEEFYVND